MTIYVSCTKLYVLNFLLSEGLCFQFIYFLAGPLAISIRLTISGANETSFAGLKSFLKKGIADAVKVPLSSIRAFVAGKIPWTRSCTTISVTITPMDKTEETNVLNTLNNDPQSFREMIDAILLEHNVHILMVEPVERVPG